MKAIGIDFGIRDSVVAICEGLQPRILANRENKAETRSVVGLKRRKGQSAKDSESEILVGDAALDNWPLAPKDTIVFVRRLVGLVISDPEVEWVKHSALYPIVEPSNGARDRVHIGRRAIEQLIQPRSRLTAEYLSTRLVEVEGDFRVRRPIAQANMRSRIGELAKCGSIFEFSINRQVFSEGKWNF